MAKVSGRVSWIAVPAMLICLGVVAVLLYLAIPAIPGAVDFVGTTLRTGTAAHTPEPDARKTDPATDCRSMYPDRLWSELTWTPDMLLSQGADAPATDAALVTALAPQVRFSCTWRVEDGRSIQTTVASVGADSAAVAQAALAGAGFACENRDALLHCQRATGSVTEIHDLRDGTWVASRLDAWEPDDYDAQVLSRVFPG